MGGAEENLIADELRVDNKALRFAPEIYVTIEQMPLIAVHPLGYEFKSNKIIFNHWPSVDEWKDIFKLYPFKDELIFAKYIKKIFSWTSLKDKEPLKLILKSQGYSENRLDDLFFLASENSVLENFWLKNIPVKLLKILIKEEQNLLTELLKISDNYRIRDNVFKELLHDWIDLSEHEKPVAITRMMEIGSEENKDSYFLLNDKFRNCIRKFRYPLLTYFNEEIGHIISSLPAGYSILYDERLEKKEITLSLSMNLTGNNLKKKLPSQSEWLVVEEIIKNLENIFNKSI